MEASALIVDDASTIRLYHQGMLESLGLKVHQAENGMDGLEQILKHTVNLILVDVNMPILDGYGFVERVRTGDVNRGVPIVMISTESESEDRKRGFEAGANLYVVKPLLPERLARLVKLLLEPK